MDTKLVNGDFERDSKGFPVTIKENKEILQRCLIRLQVHKGSFLLDKTLGSELKTLLYQKPADVETTALQLVSQALSPIREVLVDRVQCSYARGGNLRLQVYLQIGENTETLDVTVK